MADQTATGSAAAQTGAQVYRITSMNDSKQDANFDIPHYAGHGGALNSFLLQRRTYWNVAAPFKKGQVLDPMQLTEAMQVTFVPNIYNVTATYTPEGGRRLENDFG